MNLCDYIMSIALYVEISQKILNFCISLASVSN